MTALLLATAAAIVLLSPSKPAPEPVSAGRVEMAAQQTGQIWAVKAAFGRALQAAAAGEAVGQPSTPTATGEWALKVDYGRALQAAPDTQE